MFNRQVLISKENFKMHCLSLWLEDGRILLSPILMLITAHLSYLILINEYGSFRCKVTLLASDFIMSYDSLYRWYLESKNIFMNRISQKEVQIFK